jgi:hypothetical protein
MHTSLGAGGSDRLSGLPVRNNFPNTETDGNSIMSQKKKEIPE